MKVSTSQIKTLNQILNKPDVLTRYRLIQLWTVDVFTQTLDVDVKPIIEILTDDTINEESTTETIYASLLKLKRNLVDINEKLMSIKMREEHQQFIHSLICKVFDESEDEEKQKTSIDELQQLIDKNKRRIDKLQSLSEVKIYELLKPADSA